MTVFGETYRENDKPILVESVVMYADLLGVSEMARSEHALRYLRLIDEAIREAVADWEGKSEFEFATFSDSLLIARPIVRGNYKGAMTAIVAAAAALQARMIYHGILLRGGITIGEFSSQKDLVYGGALVRAAKDLEGKYAVWPRILIDRSNEQIRDLLSNTLLAQESSGLVLYDRDLWPFVNYFEGAIEFGFTDHAGALIYLTRHHLLLVSQLATPDLDPGVKAKLVWAAKQEIAAWDRLRRTYPKAIKFMVNQLPDPTAEASQGEAEWIKAVEPETIQELRSAVEKIKGG